MTDTHNICPDTVRIVRDFRATRRLVLWVAAILLWSGAPARAAEPVCGDGAVDDGEACDDGGVPAIDTGVGATGYQTLNTALRRGQTITITETTTVVAVRIRRNGSCTGRTVSIIGTDDTGEPDDTVVYASSSASTAETWGDDGITGVWIRTGLPVVLEPGIYAVITSSSTSDGCRLVTSTDGPYTDGESWSEAATGSGWNSLESSHPDVLVRIDVAGARESDVCDADCTLPQCGDGTINVAAGEDCDVTAETESCDGDCTEVVCGDAVPNLAAGEACDDGAGGETVFDDGITLAEPVGVAALDGQVLVADGDAVAVYGSDGTSAGEWDVAGDGIAVAPDGTVWVYDATNGALKRYDGVDGSLLTSVSVAFAITDFAPNTSGKLVLVAGGSLSLLNPNNGTVAAFAFELGFTAVAVAVAADGTVLVADAEGDVHQYDKNAAYGGVLIDPVADRDTSDLIVGPDGRLFVVSGSSEVEVYVVATGALEAVFDTPTRFDGIAASADTLYGYHVETKNNRLAAINIFGNSDSIADACRSDCQVAGCGDGVADSGEACDEGAETEACDDDCTAVECGDGNTNETAGEVCDGAGETAECNADCTMAECGDTKVNETAGESCDDGQETETCDDDCTAVECGDGNLNETAGETCDEAGEAEACDDDCTAVECGDGNLNETAGELCDGAGETAECNADCTPAECGDGKVNETAGEACDDSGESADCDDDCTVVECGDGNLNEAAGEACDGGSDCSDQCQLIVDEDLGSPDADVMDSDVMGSDVMDSETVDSDVMDSDVMDADVMDPDVMDPDVVDSDVMDPDVNAPDTNDPDVTASEDVGLDAGSEDVGSEDANSEDVGTEDVGSEDAGSDGGEPDVTTSEDLGGDAGSSADVGSSADAGGTEATSSSDESGGCTATGRPTGSAPWWLGLLFVVIALRRPAHDRSDRRATAVR